MYKVSLRLVPWPKGSIYISSIGTIQFMTVDLVEATSDTEAVDQAYLQARKLTKSLALKECEVQKVTETTTRDVPIK